MINSKHFLFLLLISGAVLMTNSCKKEENPPPAPAPVPVAETATDIDGNLYHTVKIGTQTWMVENLKVTHYRNGDPIPHINNLAQWTGLNYGAFANYENLGSNGEIYGRLYNWKAVFDGPLIAPEGWHIATDTEWQLLIDYLGGDAIAGGKLKESGTTHWGDPNPATNESGFTALAGGICLDQYIFLGLMGSYWTSAETGTNSAYSRRMYNHNSSIEHANVSKSLGLSVRCIKN